MKQNKSSMTALVAAFGRAYHSQYDSPKIFNDDVAHKLISPQEFADIRRNMVQGIAFFNPEIAEGYPDDPESILRWIVQVQLSPTPLARAAYCEAIVLHELSLGLKQYVILGAGLDSFAYRYPTLMERLTILKSMLLLPRHPSSRGSGTHSLRFRAIFISSPWTSRANTRIPAF